MLYFRSCPSRFPEENFHGMDYPNTRRNRPQLRNQLLRQRRTLTRFSSGRLLPAVSDEGLAMRYEGNRSPLLSVGAIYKPVRSTTQVTLSPCGNTQLGPKLLT